MTKLNIKAIQRKLRESSIPDGTKEGERNLKTKSTDGSKSSVKASYDNEGWTNATPSPSYASGEKKIQPSKDSGRPSAPSSKKMDVKVKKAGKQVSAKDPGKTATLNNMPDADKVKKRGLTNKDVGDPSFKNKANGTPPAVGAKDDIKGTVLKGLEKAVELKFSNKSVKQPESGWGIVKAGQNMSITQKPEYKKVKGEGLVAEGVINGTVKIDIGSSRKVTLEAASPKIVRKIVEGYVEVGHKVKVLVKEGDRSIYSNPRFCQSIMEAVHYDYHDLQEYSKESLKKAYKIFAESLEDEYSPFYYESKKQWKSSSVNPAFKQVKKDFEGLYESLLKPYDVTVRAKIGESLEDFSVTVSTINEDHAAYVARYKVMEEAGTNSEIVHAYVDTKKFLPESNDGLFGKKINFFNDLPDPMGSIVSKKGDGDKADNKAKSSDTIRFGNKKPKGVKVDMMKPGKKGGDVSSMADRSPSAKPYGKAFAPAGLKPSQDKGVMYEDRSPAGLMLAAAKQTSDATTAEFLTSLAEKVSNGDSDLSSGESKILDKFIELSVH